MSQYRRSARLRSQASKTPVVARKPMADEVLYEGRLHSNEWLIKRLAWMVLPVLAGVFLFVAAPIAFSFLRSFVDADRFWRLFIDNLAESFSSIQFAVPDMWVLIAIIVLVCAAYIIVVYRIYYIWNTDWIILSYTKVERRRPSNIWLGLYSDLKKSVDASAVKGIEIDHASWWQKVLFPRSKSVSITLQELENSRNFLENLKEVQNADKIDAAIEKIKARNRAYRQMT